VAAPRKQAAGATGQLFPSLSVKDHAPFHDNRPLVTIQTLQNRRLLIGQALVASFAKRRIDAAERDWNGPQNLEVGRATTSWAGPCGVAAVGQRVRVRTAGRRMGDSHRWIIDRYSYRL
jgi:hypothetical protein